KTSDWIIIATEGTTVSDGRVISASWINDMAELYDKEEYTALIWPEHYRSSWAVFEGKNWGEVEELKSGKFKDKLRLFAKVTPNKYLLAANKDGQKLFSSIEPEPDYKKEGRCYLMGLAATDSPASSGTTRMRFSRVQGGDYTELEVSQLEELDLNSCFSRKERLFSLLNEFLFSGDEHPETPPEPEDTDVTEEQLKAALKQFKGELKTELAQEFNLKAGGGNETPETPEPVINQGATVEQFSTTLETQLTPLLEIVDGLETKFNQLSREVPGQEPNDAGNGDDYSPV
ncbi:GPO family capsid scaffolding protein, partial [Vibrio sp. M260118]|uniref:GPO family capsid scaffolding protein n=1 Tax=Vibrio sp. M260118 TaxID=3020896 RepID=UPI002F42D85F